MHQDEPVGIDLRQKAGDFLLANGHVTVAEKQIDSAFDCHLQAGLVAQVNPFRQSRIGDPVLRLGEHDEIELTADHLAKAIALEPFGDPQRARTKE